ncbi:hypothetical protein HAX54_029799 [Datura stramonium]|uniref:Uncharacterized protein n=1 Tax=Datura stramonium TaxID=4076 RepID=A0ABS8V8T0_DATST|nr:hypothetical protein [Datura stramonium]
MIGCGTVARKDKNEISSESTNHGRIFIGRPFPSPHQGEARLFQEFSLKENSTNIITNIMENTNQQLKIKYVNNEQAPIGTRGQLPIEEKTPTDSDHNSVPHGEFDQQVSNDVGEFEDKGRRNDT